MATYPLTAEGLTAALTALGDTPDRVAQTLHEGGHRGNPDCDTSCPVAGYLSSLYPPEVMCSVVAEPGTGLVAELWVDTAVRAGVALPAPVAQFVERFDAHTHYTDLDWNHDPAGTGTS